MTKKIKNSAQLKQELDKINSTKQKNKKAYQAKQKKANKDIKKLKEQLEVSCRENSFAHIRYIDNKVRTATNDKSKITWAEKTPDEFKPTADKLAELYINYKNGSNVQTSQPVQSSSPVNSNEQELRTRIKQLIDRLTDIGNAVDYPNGTNLDTMTNDDFDDFLDWLKKKTDPAAGLKFVDDSDDNS